MNVRLTVRQHARLSLIVKAATGPRWRLFEPWLAAPQQASKHRVDVVAPAIAWKQIDVIMFDHCFDDVGYRAKTAALSEIRAYQAVLRGLSARRNHPALFRQAALDAICEWIPAWTITGNREPRYSPFPEKDPTSRFVVLAPDLQHRWGRQYVSWVETEPVDDRPLLTEATHLAFCDR